MITISGLKKKSLSNYKFIDLFAGIGGFHYALTSLGAKCVFASEWDKHAAETYKVNFGIEPKGDITLIHESQIPSHDILCGGFPCQAFSVSGKQKGFEDTRGTLFFDIARIVDYHKPKVLFLENVKNLAKHDEGKTLATIIKTLENLNYSVFTKVFNASHFGLPQNRERVYIVAFENSIDSKKFKFPAATNEKVCLENILENNPSNAKVIVRNDIEIYKNYTSKPSLFGDFELLNKPIQIGKVNKGGQGERIYHILGHAITLSAYGGGVGSKTGLYMVGDKIRKLSPRECARVQGFPDSFILNKADTQSYKQFGNSVSINVLQNIILEIEKILNSNNMNKEQLHGSQTAKNGFLNEDDIVNKFNNWNNDTDSQKWLLIMQYNLEEIEYVKAVKLSGYKTDVQAQVTIKLKDAIDVQNLQVKLVSNLKGFNQIDKRWTDKYIELWAMPDNIASIFKRYTGEIAPTVKNPKDERRMFANEFTDCEQKDALEWLNNNKTLIVSDILKGRGQFAAEWMLVAQKLHKDSRWILKPMNYCLNHYSNGEVVITNQGNFRIAKIGMQRKGGDGGRETAKMLQFKINPAELFD